MILNSTIYLDDLTDEVAAAVRKKSCLLHCFT